MTVEEQYRERYKSGDTPWDVGQPDFNLIEIVTQKPILSCKVLDIGCGTGDNSIWLAQNRFQVIGTDTSDIALEKAREKAATSQNVDLTRFAELLIKGTTAKNIITDEKITLNNILAVDSKQPLILEIE